MPRRLLLATIAALTLSASVLGAAEEPLEPTSNPGEFGVMLTCSARLPAVVVGCFAERTVLVLGGFEVAVGVDAQVAFSDASTGHLAPYAVLAYYGPAWSAWAELRLPHLDGVPVLGDPDYLRFGFSMRL